MNALHPSRLFPLAARSALLLGALGTLGATGCDPYERTRFDAVVTSRLGGSASPAKISVPEGMAIKARVESLDGDDEPLPGEVYSQDPSIVDVLPGPGATDYVFVGRKVGRTGIVIVADGDERHVIDAEVTAQPEP